MAIFRLSAVKTETGYRSRTSINNLIRAGLFTKPVSIGARSVGWPDDEVRALCEARIAGKTDDEIRELVEHLHSRRAHRLSNVLPT